MSPDLRGVRDFGNDAYGMHVWELERMLQESNEIESVTDEGESEPEECFNEDNRKKTRKKRRQALFSPL